MLLAAASACCQATPAPAKQRPDEFGIVVNQTFTQGGQEFYRRFTDFWREKSDFESYTLVIIERPSRRYGNQVVITFGQRVVFSGALPVKTEAIRSLSGDAVEKAYANIIAMSLRMSGERDRDMADDEI
jgi:curli production assembly/transport component CsgE